MVTVLTPRKTGYSVSEARIVRALSRSYYEFMRIFWGTIVPEDPVWNWHISYICGQIQRSAERVFAGLPCEENLLCNISPGTTKSCAFSIFSLPWIWTQMPSAPFRVHTNAAPLKHVDAPDWRLECLLSAFTRTRPH